MNAQDAIKELHAQWCALTKQELHPKATERVFYDLWREGFTADDLRCVVQMKQRFNRNNPGVGFRMNVVNVCGDLERFAADLGEARAAERNRRPAPTAKEQVQALRERPVDAEQSSTLKQPAPKSFSDVLKSMEKGGGDR